MNVDIGKQFAKEYQNFPSGDKEKIKQFIYYVLNNGLDGLPGKNKSSIDVNRDDPQFISKIEYVKMHSLWHYHIGIKYYNEDKPKGSWTSDYVIHYSNYSPHSIKIVDMLWHDPFNLPSLLYTQD